MKLNLQSINSKILHLRPENALDNGEHGLWLKEKSQLKSRGGVRTLLPPFVQKRKNVGYYHETKKALGYVTSTQSDSNSVESVYHDHSSSTSSWESDVGVGAVFKSLFVDMVLTSHLEDDKEFELTQSDDDLSIKHLNTLWDTRFKQFELPMDGRLDLNQLRRRN